MQALTSYFVTHKVWLELLWNAACRPSNDQDLKTNLSIFLIAIAAFSLLITPSSCSVSWVFLVSHNKIKWCFYLIYYYTRSRSTGVALCFVFHSGQFVRKHNVNQEYSGRLLHELTEETDSLYPHFESVCWRVTSQGGRDVNWKGSIQRNVKED